MKYKIHPAAGIFPMITGAEFDDLVADIAANGLNQPIELLANEVIDGRNRLAACEAAGIAPHYKEVVTSDPVAWVISANLRRRHMTTAQRAAIAADLANLEHGGDRSMPSNDGLKMSTKQAAKKMNVSTATVERAKKVKREDPEAHAAAKRGESVKKAPVKKTAPTPEFVMSSPAEYIARLEKLLPKKARDSLRETTGHGLPSFSWMVMHQAQKALEKSLNGLAQKDQRAALKVVSELIEYLDSAFSLMVLDRNKKLQTNLNQQIEEQRKGMYQITGAFTKEEYTRIRGILHPDGKASGEKAKYDKAFTSFDRVVHAGK